MDEDVPLCFRVLLQRRPPLDDEYTKSLENIHQFVFLGENTDESCTSMEPAEMFSSCESAAKKFGVVLDVKGRDGSPGLSVPAVVVEVLLRLTRILFWEVVLSVHLPERAKEKILNSDMKALELSLLPRLFLKIPVTPIALQTLLMKAPLSAFARRYARGGGFTSPQKFTLPSLVAEALLSLKINFGLDLLAGTHVETPTLHGRNTLQDIVSPVSSSDTTEKVIESEKNALLVSKDRNMSFDTSTALPKRGTGEDSSSAARAHHRSVVMGERRPQGHFQERPRQCLPAYMLTRRRSSGVPSKCEVQLIEQQKYLMNDSPNEKAAADFTSEEEEGDAEVLAPATPVKKRIRKDIAAVPPSPFRPPREEL